MPKGVKKSSRKKRSNGSELLPDAMHDEIQALVQHLPAQLIQERLEKQQREEGFVFPNPDTSLAVSKKKRVLVGSVALFSLAIFTLWVFNAKQLVGEAFARGDKGILSDGANDLRGIIQTNKDALTFPNDLVELTNKVFETHTPPVVSASTEEEKKEVEQVPVKTEETASATFAEELRHALDESQHLTHE